MIFDMLGNIIYNKRAWVKMRDVKILPFPGFCQLAIFSLLGNDVVAWLLRILSKEDVD